MARELDPAEVRAMEQLQEVDRTYGDAGRTTGTASRRRRVTTWAKASWRCWRLESGSC